MLKDNYFLLTGAPGSGKSTLLKRLGTLGFPGITEPARDILAEQRGIDGDGTPDRDPRLFVGLMLSRMIYEYSHIAPPDAAVFFDRGVPDILAYAANLGFEYPPARNAARAYRYHSRVFFAPAWEEIYITDEERTMSFALAQQFDSDLRRIYTGLGYTLIDLPLVPVEQRADFLLARI